MSAGGGFVNWEAASELPQQEAIRQDGAVCERPPACWRLGPGDTNSVRGAPADNTWPISDCHTTGLMERH